MARAEQSQRLECLQAMSVTVPGEGTQGRELLLAMQRGERLTALDALRICGCMRLAARVHDLRKAGWPIVEETIKTTSGKRVARYRMGE